MPLELTASQLQTMVAHCRAGLPNEACGLLGGRESRVLQVYPVANADHSPISYTMDPEEQVRVLIEIEAARWDLVGIFHSHPHGPPFPSQTDLARAYYPDSVYVILAPDARGEWQARGFRLDEGRAREVELRITSPNDTVASGQ